MECSVAPKLNIINVHVTKVDHVHRIYIKCATEYATLEAAERAVGGGIEALPER